MTRFVDARGQVVFPLTRKDPRGDGDMREAWKRRVGGQYPTFHRFMSQEDEIAYEAEEDS